jgi:phospholipase/carboxylesterase
MLQHVDLLYTAHVPEGEGPHPTLVLLHGWGASAHDLLGLAPIFGGGQTLVLCPQGKLAMEIAPGMPGYGWFPLGEGREPQPSEVADARDSVEAFLAAACERYPVDRKRLVLGGFSQGGVMAYHVALRDPERFAALLALSSWLPPDVVAQVTGSPGFDSLPTLVTHGTQDPVIPVERGVESRDALVRLGVPTRYREYEMGHEINPNALRDVLGWLEEKVLSPAGSRRGP